MTSPARPWYFHLGVISLAGFVIPPAAFILLWARKHTAWWRKLLLTFPLLILGVAHLMLLWGMRLQSDGTGIPRYPYFPARSDSHYAAIERRAEAERVLPTPTPAPAPADASAAVATPAPAPWPAFLGPNRDAQYTGPILTHWPEKGLTENWRRPIGGGYASVIVAGGQVITIEQRRNQEVVAAYSLDNGRELWTNAWDTFFQESMGGDGPRATPTWDGGRVYALGAAGEFRCLDGRTGKTLWRKNILEDNGAGNIQWGMSASPLISGSHVIVLPGGGGGKSVVAYDKLSGARAWSALDDKAAYTAPMLATLNERRVVLAVTAERAVGLEPENGKLVWEFPWKTEYDVNSAMPVITGPNRFLLTAGYGHGAALVEVSGGGAREVWKSQALKNKFNTSALRGGVVYGLDEGILAAVDVETGQRRWKGGRYGYGQLLMAGEFLVVVSEQGEVALVRADPEKHLELARFQALDGKTWNVPALASGHLLVRNQTELASYRIAP